MCCCHDFAWYTEGTNVTVLFYWGGVEGVTSHLDQRNLMLAERISATNTGIQHNSSQL